MKKSLILLSICSAVLLTSCGTSSYYASSGFEDGIYYRASKDVRDEAEADSEEVRRLIEQTRQEAARFSDTIIIASPDARLELEYTPQTQYTIMFDDSLDSLGQVNLNFNFDDWYPGYGYGDYWSYWDWRYWDVFGPMWYRGWWGPWYGHWGWYDPWYYGWSWGFSFAWDPWFGPWGGWYAGWYGPGWWGWYDPWYWSYPVASYIGPTYYGKRNTGVRSGTVSGGRQLAAASGSVRSGRSAHAASAPAMSAVRGRTASSAGALGAGRLATAGRTSTARTFQASGSGVNLGERYVSRGSIGSSGTNVRRAVSSTQGRTTAYSTGNTFRRPSGTSASVYRRPAGSSASGFRSPFEGRSSSFGTSYSTGGRRFESGVTYGRQNGYGTRSTTINRNSYNTTNRTSFSTGGYSRSSSMGVRSSGGGSVRSGGGGVRR